MRLPVELIDEILGHLPPYDEKSLRSCSLVAKSWLHPSQRRLFVSAFIGPETYQSWLDNISPKNTGLLRHLRSLEYVVQRSEHNLSHPLRRIDDDLRDYLPSFYQLQSLTLGSMDIRPLVPAYAKLFFAFRHTLSSLSLVGVSTTLNALVTIVGYFPNLRNLEIHDMSFEAGSCPTPHLPYPLRGRPSVQWTKETGRELFLDRFSGLNLEYSELVITGEYEQRIVTAVEGSLKRLKLTLSSLTSDLSRCPELHQLELILMFPREEDMILIQSITSTNLRKLIFAPYWPILMLENFMDDPCWITFDDLICRLVDRLRVSGYANTLEVEFQLLFSEPAGEAHHKTFLPRFKEKGRVTVTKLPWP